MRKQLVAIITREDDGFVSLCPELDIASQGDTIEAARANLMEAVNLWLEVADEAEVQQRLARAPAGVVIPFTVDISTRVAA